MKIENSPEHRDNIFEIATRFPYHPETVQWVFDYVKSYEITENILIYAAQRAIPVYLVMRALIEDARRLMEKAAVERIKINMHELFKRLDIPENPKPLQQKNPFINNNQPWKKRH